MVPVLLGGREMVVELSQEEFDRMTALLDRSREARDAVSSAKGLRRKLELKLEAKRLYEEARAIGRNRHT